MVCDLEFIAALETIKRLSIEELLIRWKCPTALIVDTPESVSAIPV